MWQWLGKAVDSMRQRRQAAAMHPRMATGRRGEDLAHRYLQSRGYTVVGRNVRSRSGRGEVDIVARDGNAVVFVEVKTRHSDEFGAPDRAMDREKRLALIRAARDYLRHSQLDPSQVRFDTISIVLGTPVEMRHFQNVFPFERT